MFRQSLANPGRIPNIADTFLSQHESHIRLVLIITHLRFISEIFSEERWPTRLPRSRVLASASIIHHINYMEKKPSSGLYTQNKLTTKG